MPASHSGIDPPIPWEKRMPPFRPRRSDAPPREVRPRNKWVSGLAVAVAVGLLLFSGLRLVGLERGFPLVPLMAYAPLVLFTIPVLVVAFLLMRRFAAAGAAMVAFALLAIAILPRLIDEGPIPPEVPGPELRVLTLNTHFGSVAPETIVDLAREHEMDVLTLQEVTPELYAGLEEAGLAEVLPYSMDHSAPAADGGTVHSVYPLTPVGDPGREIDSLSMPHTSLEVPGTARPVEVVSVHPMSPRRPSSMEAWEWGLLMLPPATEDTTRILAGDFNATLDHAAMRHVVFEGYVDAADVTGQGLTGTWPVGKPLPKVALDHVLVDHRAAVDGLDFLDVEGTTHRALVADLTLPGE
ncbi:endonuclease/exonuclease/phosphatase family protein [Nocardiopsis alba]|uniref:endonuclease/exonuclease/phosphatase family protein n=1 Tax=Nocardiopsis alba TaxID=53437 RepID=UPI0033E88EF0